MIDDYRDLHALGGEDAGSEIGFEDRRQYMGDPAFVDVSLDMLTSHSHADTWRERIDMQRARAIWATPTASSCSDTPRKHSRTPIFNAR